ncbi:MAG: phospho-sugar mutase, partial [Actinobacteria bacterium]|nr:phospho-sugar mutase [Actinomycetota bacterium]
MTGSLRALAQQWLAADPDPQTQDEIQVLLAGPEEDLEQRFNGRLAFGTAGLRGPLAAGPQGMNRVLVRMTAAAIGQRLLEEHADPLVVIGYDARHKSEVFAEDSARVLAALGVRSCLLPEALPTPVLAFSVRHLKADAGIMVTASHNPRQDNGYKVYWADGAQINTPIDSEISAHLDALTPDIALA